MHDRVTICGGVLGGHPRLVADEILALSVANTVLRESRKIPGLDRRHERRSVDLVCCDQLS